MYLRREQGTCPSPGSSTLHPLDLTVETPKALAHPCSATVTGHYTIAPINIVHTAGQAARQLARAAGRRVQEHEH